MPISKKDADQIAFNLNGHHDLARLLGQPVPRWLRSVWAVLGAGGRGALLDGFREYARDLDDSTAYSGLGLNNPNPDMALAWRPSEQVRQLIEVLLCVWTNEEEGLPQAIDGQDPLQARLQVGLWRQQVLQAMPDGKLGEAPPPSANTDSISMPIMLVHSAAHDKLEGCVAQLHLALVPCPGASLHLLPSLVQAGVPMTQSFTNSLDAVVQLWRQTLPPAAAKDRALVWDLRPQKGGYHLLSGPSASAAFGLAGLWLMRQNLPAPWREPMARLALADFNTLYLSAELLADGALVPVGGIDAKDKSLDLARAALGARWGRERPLYVAANQLDVTLLGDHLPLLLCRKESLLEVARAVVTRPMSAAQTALCEALSTALAALPYPPASARGSCPDHLPPHLATADPELGAALAALDNQPLAHPSSHPLHYALRCWAQRGRSISGQFGGRRDGQVHQRFVPMQVSASHQTDEGNSLDQTFDTLEQLLAEFEGGKLRHECPSAFLIEGDPGSGKSWLMARHEQALAEQFIWNDQQGGEANSHSEGFPVLPLYLPLNLLPPDADPVAFYRQWLVDQYPDERLCLVQRLDPARRQKGPQDYRLRLMIDGLNEVKALINPEARAKEAVIKLWKAFAPELPMVLGIRPRRGWMLGDPHERFTVRNALLNTWQRPHIETYLKRRWGEGDSRVGEFLKGLAEGSAHETLLGTPLFLNLQCELWEAGATTLLANRAHLLASMVWLRLGQELAKATVQAGQIRGPLGGLDMLSPLELQRAREFVANPGMPPEFPRQGWLLKGLFAQAKAQWLAKPEADPQTRGQVALAQSAVERSLLATGLPEDALDGWFKAVEELGLTRLARTGQHSEHQFRYEHQVFGEWLASAELFYSGAALRRPGEQPLPAHWAPEALDRLAQELAPPPLALSAEDELLAQRQRTAQAWADPRLSSLFTNWLLHGLSLPLAEVKRALYQARRIPFWRSNMLDVYQNQLGIIALDVPGGRCAWRFDGWVRASVRAETVKPQTKLGRNPQDAWHEDPAVWAAACQSADLWPVFQQAAKQAMIDRLGQERCTQLWGMGRLGLPPPGGLDDIVPLALDALGDVPLLAWLGWLAEAGPWALCSVALALNRERLRALGGGNPGQADAVAALWAKSSRRLLAVVGDAGVVQGAVGARCLEGGADPRQRLQAGELLGAQGAPGSPEGDHLRFERSGPGLRLREAHWLPVGGPGQRFRLGDPACGDDAGPFLMVGDGPGLSALHAFQIAQLPVTVAEYQCFIDDGGYGNEKVPAPSWWQAAGPAAVDWLKYEKAQQPRTWDRLGFSGALLPVTGVTWYEALAYCHWAADRLYADRLVRLSGADPLRRRWGLRLPTEWEWEGALRGPHTGPADAPALAWPGHGPQASDADEPGPMLFNHAATGWARPSPVGCWGASQTASGLLDGVGNAWSWCANVKDDDWGSTANGQTATASKSLTNALRALRGGSFGFVARRFRVGYRLGRAPGDPGRGSGFRLVLAVAL
jgi:formylglycine-generating enzyme required for sulfatase activity